MNHLDQRELQKNLDKAVAQIKIGADYIHYKDSSKTYIVRDVAILEATNEPVVIYQAQYGEKIIFVRPLAEWLELINNNGFTMSRFRLKE